MRNGCRLDTDRSSGWPEAERMQYCRSSGPFFCATCVRLLSMISAFTYQHAIITVSCKSKDSDLRASRMNVIKTPKQSKCSFT